MKRGLAFLVLLSLAIPPTTAQVLPAEVTSNLMHVSLQFPDGPELNIPNYEDPRNLRFTVTDSSQDGAPDGGPGQPHRVRISVEALNNDEGWNVFTPFESFSINPGETKESYVTVRPTANTVDSDLRLRINITLESQICCGSTSTEGVALIRSPGSYFAFLRADSDVNPSIRPDTVYEGSITVTNPGLLERRYRLEVSGNDCGLFVSSATVVVPEGESRTIDFTILSPSDQFYYRFHPCNVGVQVVDLETKNPSNTVSYQLIVKGFYIDPGVIANILIVLALIGGVIWFILLAKRRAEEEILGKPQPPWTLPAEQVYLQELEKKDPQAAYVVRHFLMEDEYASSLMWYYAYKKATRGRRAMERKVIKMEHAFEKWDAKQQDQLTRADDQADKQLDKLQAKLDKKTRKAHKKEHKKWAKEVSKLESKAANDHNKAMNEWRKAAKKARKKGEPEPKQPTMTESDLPPEPQEERVLLDDHKWAAKKERILEKAATQSAKDEERYETQRAKKLEAMRKKMEKLADKIDDPEFVEEHPLLRDAASS